jgi:hypothetical protein
MREVLFDRARVQELIEAIDRGGPIVAGAGDRPLNDLLMVAGACIAAVQRAEMAALAHRGQRRHPEHLELEVQSRRDDLTASVLYLTNTTLALMVGACDVHDENRTSVHVELVDVPSYEVRAVGRPAGTCEDRTESAGGS